jgi:predicted nucleotidyltransferase
LAEPTPISLNDKMLYLSEMNGGLLNKKIIYSEIQKNKKVLEQFGVKQIGLFGSFVRDEGTDKSDIDFLVDFEKGKKTFDNFMDLAFFLEDLFQRKVEVITRQGLSPYIGPHILKTLENVPLAS